MVDHDRLSSAGRRTQRHGGRRAGKRIALAAGALAVLMSGLVSTIRPAEAVVTLVVTIEEDIVNPDDGETSLREAVAMFSSTLADEIVFGPGVVAVTIYPPIEIRDPMTINGPGVTVSAVAKYDRIFDIDLSDRGADLVTLRGLTVSGGFTHPGLENPDMTGGGGIRARSVQLELDSVTIRDNSSHNLGGGVYVGGQGTGGTRLRMTNSTISSNQAFEGGGLYTESADVIIDRSTISNNEATIAGGLTVFDSILTMENSTVSGNTARDEAGGMYVDASFAAIRHSTVNDNRVGAGGTAGGLLWEFSEGLLTHSIFANSTYTGAPPTVGGPPYDVVIRRIESSVDARYVLIEALHDPHGALVIGAGPAIITADPALAPLAQAGLTASHRPLPGSPVIDAGDPAIANAPPTDQAGSARIQGPRIDLGSVEASSANLSVAKTCSPGPVAPGATVNCTVTVSNAGPTVAQNVSVSDDLPAGVSLGGTPAGTGFTCGVGDPFTCTLPSLAANASARFSFSVLVSGNVTPGASLVNTATVSSASPDPHPANNTARASTSVVTCTITGAGDIPGTAGNDVICGSAGDDRIAGLGGDDVIFGLGGNDQLSGGDGNDTLLGGDGSDTLVSGNGNDRLYGGGVGVDRLSGGAGDDYLDTVDGSTDDYLVGSEHVAGDTCVGDTGDAKALCEA